MLSPVIRNGMQLYKTNNYNHQRTKNLKNQGINNFKINNTMKSGTKQKITPDQNLSKSVGRSNLGSKTNITILEKITEGEELDTSIVSQSQSSKEKDETHCCIFNKNYTKDHKKKVFRRITDTCTNSVYRLYYRFKNKRRTNSEKVVKESAVNKKYNKNEISQDNKDNKTLLD
uniref:Uncharacterized protein n=1 Tax=Strongyloides papillosus TaxID=174720 RepID=A0A0N5BZG2_STREA